MKVLFSYFPMLLFCCMANFAFAQGWCGQHKSDYENDPELKLKHEQFEDKIQAILEEQDKLRKQGFKVSNDPVSIPVVFHVMNFDNVGNIPNQQIEDALIHLNDAFSGTGAFIGSVDTNIEFCLAQREPDGSASTGIDRILSAAFTIFDADMEDVAMKSTTSWPSEDYLNIWTVAQLTKGGSTNVAGYGTLPSAHGTFLDGIVLEANPMGQSAEGSVTLIHEAGHYLGLYHTFEGGCLNDDCRFNGDRVCDTPPDVATFDGCLRTNSCSTDTDDTGAHNPLTSDVDDLNFNFMDYNPASCATRFTQGQAVRMCAVITGVGIPNETYLAPRVSLTQNANCLSPCPANQQISGINVTGLQPPTDVPFTLNLSATASATTGTLSYEWELDGVTTTGAQYNPTITVPGIYTLTLLVSNNANSDCFETRTFEVEATCPTDASFTISDTNPGELDNVTFAVANPVAGDTYEWLDGAGNPLVAANTTQSITTSFGIAGNQIVTLVVHSPNCDESETAVIYVGNCQQGFGNQWRFGIRAGLDFNNYTNGFPSTLTTPVVSFEASTSYCNQDGELLFYSDGFQVRDAADNLFENPVTGEDELYPTNLVRSSTQGALAVPNPGNADQYYIFLTGGLEGTVDELRFSIVDVSQNTIVDMAGENSTLLEAGTPFTERLTAIQHCNGDDYWIVTHERFNNEYYVFLLTSTGVQLSNVYAIGNIHNQQEDTESWFGEIGYLKASSDGTKLACAARGSILASNNETPRVELFDFDNNTGEISNFIEISSSTSFDYRDAYGIEFSPDNSLLYITTKPGFRFQDRYGAIYQFDLTKIHSASTPTEIQQARELVALAPDNMEFHALQMGPDGRIYVGELNARTLGVIANPNVPGTGCDYTSGVIGFPSFFGPYKGLPNFPNNLYYQPSIQGPREACPSQVLSFTASTSACEAGTYTWWIDGDAQIVGSDELETVEVQFGTGLSTLHLEIETGCGTQSATQELQSAVCGVRLGMEGIFMEGPYDLNQERMTAFLSIDDHLPEQHPYGNIHNGTEEVDFNVFEYDGLTDWVLIELRDVAFPSVVVDSRAVFVNNNGLIIDTESLTSSFFPNAPTGRPYYISVNHRNHLRITTALPYVLDLVSETYDFQNLPLFGTNPARNINGTMVMWGGDANSSELVNSADRVQVWNDRNLIGYLDSDLTMNGFCNSQDRTLCWNNRNLTSQLPQ